MNRLWIVAAAVTAVASLASASTILAPAGWGNVTSYSFHNAFNAQPTWGGTAPVGGDVGYSELWSTWEGGSKVSYIDLGEDWADWRIEQTWTKVMQWRAGPGHPYAELWWDDDNDATNDGAAETTLNFCTQANTGSFQWLLDVDISTNPIAPQGRYLMLKQTAEAPPQADAIELALVGEIVPEPATLVLLGLGALAGIRRRR